MIFKMLALCTKRTTSASQKEETKEGKDEFTSFACIAKASACLLFAKDGAKGSFLAFPASFFCAFSLSCKDQNWVRKNEIKKK